MALIAQDVGVCVDVQFGGEVEQRQDTWWQDSLLLLVGKPGG